MDWKQMIDKRRSVRSYTGVPVEEKTLKKIRDFMAQMKPLYPEIKVCGEIVGRDAVKCICPWTTAQLVAIYSEEKDGFLENVGFLFQQLDLYLQSSGLGSCWLGMGRMDSSVPAREDGLKFVILLAFGYPKGMVLRSGVADFKRKSPAQIADREDSRLEAARIAPSSVNSQPWYFTHEGEMIHAYCKRSALLKSLSEMNLIDMGIALAQLYAVNPDSFRFFKTAAPPIKGCEYIGSFTL